MKNLILLIKAGKQFKNKVKNILRKEFLNQEVGLGSKLIASIDKVLIPIKLNYSILT